MNMRPNTRTRALALLLALVMTLGLCPALAAEDGPVRIGSAEELAAFRDRVNAGENTLDAVLTADIALTGDWTPFEPASGYVTEAYAGTFDGGGHTVRGLSIHATTANQGLFGVINGATIQNVKVEGNVTSSGNNVGGIVGRLQQGSVRNCSFSGSVTTTMSRGYVGGITGYAGNTAAEMANIEGCANTATVTGATRGTVGGIVGYAKYTKITNCYNTGSVNGATRAGGIAGQLQNNCSATGCYNSGALSGSGTAGGICDFLYASSSLSKCYSYSSDGTLPLSGAGTGTVADDCEAVISTEGLADKLGDAFATDSDGNLILTWQAGKAPAPKDPKLTVTGPTALYDTNSGPKPAVTLTTVFQDLDPAQVTWSLEAGEDVVELVKPDNADENDTTISVQTLKPGRATVKATVRTNAVESGQLSAEVEITVWPFVTTVEVVTPMTVATEDSGEATVTLTGAAAGQVARAKINVYGGGELNADIFPVTVQWKYLSAQDYDAGNTAGSSYRDIPGATSLEYTVPQEREGDYLSFTFRYQNEDKAPNRPYLVRSAERAAEEAAQIVRQEQTAQQLRDVLAYCSLHPVWGQDENVARVLEDYLAAHDLPGFTATVRRVEEVYGGGGVAETGDITYFYADPNTTPAIHNASCKVTFTLSREGEALDVEVPVVIPWDQTRVKAVLREEIADQLALNVSGPVTGDLSLPKVVDGKRWALVSWTSSDPDVISISDQNQTTADTLFDPYVGLVKRGTADQNVTLTATVAFQFAGDDAPISLTLTYPLTVRALEPTQEELIRAGLLAKLESGLAAAGVTDTVTGERLTPDAGGVYTATHDIQLPTTRDFGVDGKYYPVTVTTDCSALTAPDVNNAARVALLRPGVDLPDAAGTVTVTLHDRDTGVTAALSLPFRVPALTRSEVETELALMDRVKAAYFEGLRGDNTSRDDIRFDLKPFFEVYEENGALVWVRSNAQRTGQGVAPIPMEGWEDLELWRLFRSSNPNVISHEDLRVTRQSEAKAVTVTSHLSSQTLGRYGQLYLSDPVQYAQYALLAPLYDQEVTTDLYPDPPVSLLSASPEPTAQTPSDTLVVRGTRDPESSVPVVETVDNVTFSLTGLDGQVWLPKTTFSQLPESSTVYDVFLQALGEDYTATRVKGTYIRAISGPQGALTEQEHGENSGWMYRVNGLIPEVYMGGCSLHTGDVVEVFYTRDASQEVSTWTRPSTGNTSSVGSVRPQRPDTDPVSEPDQPLLPPSFTDVPADAWYATALAFVYDAGLMEGVSANRFAPDMPLTRGMLVSMLYRLNAPALKPSAPSFPDVAPDAWYAPGVTWAAEAGLVKGYDDGRFGPEDPITREQLATLLFRYAQHIGRNTAGRDSLTGFSDGDTVSAWAQDAMAWTVDSGVLTGLPGDVLAPAVTTTRAQAAAMLQRFCRSSG